MADYPIESLGGKTPMEAAVKPNMDYLAQHGRVGLVRTVAPGLSPGSDVANLSVMGYDPKTCYTGRSPLEAVSMGIKLSDSDVALRCNLVTLSEEADYAQKTMVDYCGGDIHTEEAALLIQTIQERLGNELFTFYSGIQYRHCLVWHKGTVEVGKLTPPHDISGRVIGEHLNSNPLAAGLIKLMRKSYDILKEHPVNLKRLAEGKNPANSIWLWGQGTRPELESFEAKFGKKGSVISAVDLLKGIGKCAGMNVCEVAGATGYIDTCFEAKARAGLAELENGQDFVYLHFEAPDECGHRRETENKVKSIELIDSLVLSLLRRELAKYEHYRILLLPDHPTPLSIATHTSEPVPFLLYDNLAEAPSGVLNFNEASAKAAGLFVEHGPDVSKLLFSE
jgi:2,3-bisphosphoglycerate-independent phosphoglycerate mutase